MGRAGSTYIQQLLLDNLGIRLDEWFSPYSYRVCLEARDCNSKEEYLEFVYRQLSTSTPDGLYVKVTPDICSKDFWERDILNDRGFIDALSSTDSVLLILRNDIVSWFSSMLYSEMTGSWHENEEGLSNMRSNIHGGAFVDFFNRRILEMLDSELRMVDTLSSTRQDYTLMFKEDMVSDLIRFSLVVLDHYSPTTSIQELKIPKIAVHAKDGPAYKKIRGAVIELINGNSDICNMIIHRSNFFSTKNVYSRHFSLTHPFIHS